MDINGTRFHLIADERDWQTVTDTSPAGGAAAWDPVRKSMGLKPLVPVFPRGRRSLPLTPDVRRGAASDRFGTWYWIGQDQQTLFRAPAATTRAMVYWQQASESTPARSGSFIEQAPSPKRSNLAGLAVTTHHYLVVGILDPAGLLIFDLHAGGEPVRLEFPPESSFVPFDLAAAPDGGVWALDHAHRRLWGMDRYFRLIPLGEPVEIPPQPGSFSSSGMPEAGEPTLPIPQGLPLTAVNPVAIESLPNGGLLVLDSPVGPGESSRLFYYARGLVSGALLPPEMLVLPGLIETADEADETMVIRSIVGHDVAYQEEGGRLYVVERDGNQAVAYALKLPGQTGEQMNAAVEAIFLPMHYHGGRAIAAGAMPNGETAVFYDVTPFPDRDLSVRWLRLQPIDRPRYIRASQIETPILDGHQRGCVWHRLFLDACIPPQTEVRVLTRCGDDSDLLATQSYLPEPPPYLRSMGSEIAYWQGWPVEEGQSSPENIGNLGSPLSACYRPVSADLPAVQR
jgi:hypothetical protein